MTKSILIADDEVNVRQALRLLLEGADYKLQGEAEDAAQLLAQVRQAAPDVILLDWELPGLSVQRLLAVLREMNPAAAVFALSARQEERPHALAAGVTAFVSKGDSPDQLLSLLGAPS